MSEKRIYISIIIILCPVFIFAQQYDPVKAVQYAERWWNDFNTRSYHKDTAAKWGGPYYNYSLPANGGGGDCAAFASQCLIYGGLDLSAGTNGHGAYVKPDGVIAGAQELLQHLRDIQQFPYQAVKGGRYKAEPSFTAPGHLAILEDANHNRHTIFCVSVVDGKNVYNAHTNPAHHEKRSYWDYPDAHYIHIGPVPQEYPAHCDNCRQDEDETGLDCGGSCPPCGDAPDNRVVVQNNIKAKNYALIDISTNGPLVLNSGSTPFTFIAGTEIILNSGFEVTAGTEFTAKTSSNRNELTRNFRKVCVGIPNIFTPNGDGINDFFGVNAAGITFISVIITDRNMRIVKPYYEMEVYEDGFIALWDGGNQPSATAYGYIITITTYEGNSTQYEGWVSLLR
jgi:gliding motility-associated-like protein